MRDYVSEIPQEYLGSFLDGYWSGGVLYCEFSFTKKIDGKKAVAELLSCLRRVAKKTKIEFKIVPTGNISRKGTQVHFHLIVLPVNVNNNDLHRLKFALRSRWGFVGNGRAIPTAEDLTTGYCVVRTQDEYIQTFRLEGEKLDDLQTCAAKWGYNLRVGKNDWLQYEDERLSKDIFFSTNKRYHKPT